MNLKFCDYKFIKEIEGKIVKVKYLDIRIIFDLVSYLSVYGKLVRVI